MQSSSGNSPSRRSFVKLLAAAPLLSQIAARDLYAQAASAVGHDPRSNVYTRLGVKTTVLQKGPGILPRDEPSLVAVCAAASPFVH